MAINKDDEIKKIMESTGLGRVDAAFIYAQEHEDLEGDVIAIPDNEEPTKDDD